MVIQINKLKIIALVVISVVLIATIGYQTGYQGGYEKGVFRGISVSLDTVKTILEKQLNSDSNVSRLILINPDTNAYILSPKTIKVD